MMKIVFIFIFSLMKLFDFQVYETNLNDGIIKVVCLVCIRKSIESTKFKPEKIYQQLLDNLNIWNDINIFLKKKENSNADEVFSIKLQQKYFLLMKKSDKITFYPERSIKKQTRQQEISKKLMCKFENSNSHKNYWCGVNNSTNEINFYFVKKNYMKCDLTVESSLNENEKKFCIVESCSNVKKKNYCHEENSFNSTKATSDEKFFNSTKDKINTSREILKITSEKNLISSLENKIESTSFENLNKLSTKFINNLTNSFNPKQTISLFINQTIPATRRNLNSSSSKAVQNSKFFTFNFYSLPLKRMMKELSIKKDFVDCMKNCSYNGKCVSFDEEKFFCQCHKNYTGKECQIDLQSCKHNLCLNKGACTITGNKSYKCSCKKNYYGSNCQFEVNWCKNETCSNHGYCFIENYRPKCKCFNLYSGVRCEIVSNELKVIKQISQGSKVLAIIIIALFWLVLILIDITNYLNNSKGRKILKKKSIPVKLVYIN